MIRRLAAAVKRLIGSSPYRSHHLLPTMAPLAPWLVLAIDRAHLQRTPRQSQAALAHTHPPREIERHAPCPLCGHDVVRVRFRARYGSGANAGSYRVGQCDRCRLLYRVPAIRPERVPELYSTGDYSTFLDGDYSHRRQDLYRTILDAFSPMLDDGNGRTLLDFGCGTGLFMEVAAERGFDVHGVDLAPDAVERAREKFGVERVAADPAGLGPNAPERFDVITLLSVLAHVAEPHEQIRALHDLLVPGGRLVVYTVNADSLERRAFGGRWNGFTRNHLIFWDERNLRRLLREAGFSAVDHRHFYGIPRENTAFPRRLTERHYRAVERWNGGNMLHVVATR